MWVARDKYGKNLTLFVKKCPVRDEGKGWWYEPYEMDSDEYEESIYLPSNLFPNLTWKDEPIEVEVVSKKFMDMWRAKNAAMTKMFEQEDEGMVDIPSEVVDAVDKDLFDLTVD